MPPQPDGQRMPVTLKLTVLEASCVSVAGSSVDVAVDSGLLTLLPVSVAVLSPAGCCVQPTASITKNAARSFSFIGPLSNLRVDSAANQ